MSEAPSYVHLLRSDIDSEHIDLSELATSAIRAEAFGLETNTYPSLQLSPLDTRRGPDSKDSEQCWECQRIPADSSTPIHENPIHKVSIHGGPLRRVLEPESDSGIESQDPEILNHPIRKEPSPPRLRSILRPQQYEGPTPTFPARNSDLMGAQMATLYLMSLLRDLSWPQWGSSPLVRAGCQALNQLNAQALIKDQMTPLNLFRCSKRMTGLYVSQFLYRSVKDGAFMRGCDPTGEGASRYILTGRDLAWATHTDNLLDFFWNLRIFFSHLKIPLRSNFEGESCLLEIQLILSAVTRKALLGTELVQPSASIPSPEAYGQEIARTFFDRGSSKISDDLLQNRLMALLKSHQGNYLLSQVYPTEAHTFPSKTAIVTGACVTVLKFFYQTSTPLPIYEPSPDGARLILTPRKTTVGAELDQLSFNIGLGRCWAGLNYPIDIIEGLKMGQQIALRYLESKIVHKGPTLVPLYNGKSLTIGATINAP